MWALEGSGRAPGGPGGLRGVGSDRPGPGTAPGGLREGAGRAPGGPGGRRAGRISPTSVGCRSLLESTCSPIHEAITQHALHGSAGPDWKQHNRTQISKLCVMCAHGVDAAPIFAVSSWGGWAIVQPQTHSTHCSAVLGWQQHNRSQITE